MNMTSKILCTVQITTITTNFEYADLDCRMPVQSNFSDWKAAGVFTDYTSVSIYTCTKLLECSVVARLSNHHQGLPQGLFSACSYLLKPTGNHDQTQKGVLGVVSSSFTPFRFTTSFRVL